MAPTCLDPNKNVFRFVVLFFNCMLTFGSYYCFDMPSVLQSQMQGNCNGTNGTNSSDVHGDCLGLDADQYNLLYAIYAWTNAIVVIGAGFLIDKVGNRAGVFLFSFLCVVGSCLFAVGPLIPKSRYMFPLMVIGRLIFGAGNGSLTIVQNRITSYWFHRKELAMAFGITLAFSRLGSVLNFFFTESLEEKVGLATTLWIGAALCAIGFACAVIVGILDRKGIQQLGQANTLACESRQMKFTHIRHFSLSFWLLCLTIMFFYNGIFPFVADASKFIQDKYGYEPTYSSYIAGAVYDVSMVLSPFLGGIIDVFGKRGILALACAVLTTPVFGFLAFTELPPLLSTLWLGVTYSVAAASMWPSIPLVVSQSTLGTALGLATSCQMIGIGISNVVIGAILGKNELIPVAEELHRWQFCMIYLLINIVLCCVVALLLNFTDVRQGGILNLSRKQKRELLVVPNYEPEERNEDADAGRSETDPLLPKFDNSVNRA